MAELISKFHVIEQVMQRDDEDAVSSYEFCGEILQGGEDDHAAADGVDHLQEMDFVGEEKAEADDGHFDEDEPEAAGDELLCDFVAGASAQALQVDGSSGEGYESGRAEMSNPAGGEERGPGCEWVGGVDDGCVGEEVARVIEGQRRS